MGHWEAPVKLFAGGMVFFVAYEGFELIANAAPDIENPEKISLKPVIIRLDLSLCYTLLLQW